MSKRRHMLDRFADELENEMFRFQTWPDSSDQERTIELAAAQIVKACIDAARRAAKQK